MDLQDLKKEALSIEERNAPLLDSRIASGNVRSFEIMWATLVWKYFRYKSPAFTVQERAGVKSLFRAYEPEGALKHAANIIKHWAAIRIHFATLPSIPTFQIFFRNHRDIVILAENEMRKVSKISQKEEERKRDFEEAKSFKTQEKLTDMFKRFKREQQHGR